MNNGLDLPSNVYVSHRVSSAKEAMAQYRRTFQDDDKWKKSVQTCHTVWAAFVLSSPGVFGGVFVLCWFSPPLRLVYLADGSRLVVGPPPHPPMREFDRL